MIPPIEDIPRDKPIEAMQLCEIELSQLPDNFVHLPVEEAVQILTANRVVDSTFYFVCQRNHRELVEWINAE